jgi:uncharacterized membrane protein
MDNTYLWLKTLHVIGVILFIGNIIITGWWKNMADRTRHPAVIAFAQRQVTLTDYIFTAGGATLLGVTGIANAVIHDLAYYTIPWLKWPLLLFIASGLTWLLILVPIQIKQARLSRTFAGDGNIPEAYWRLGLLWNVFGVIAIILPLIATGFMVFKPL